MNMKLEVPGRTHSRWVLFLLSLAYVLNFVDRQVLAIVAGDVKAELGLSDTQLGMLVGAGVRGVLHAVRLRARARGRYALAQVGAHRGAHGLEPAHGGLRRRGQLLAARDVSLRRGHRRSRGRAVIAIDAVGLLRSGAAGPSALGVRPRHLSRHDARFRGRWSDRRVVRLAYCIRRRGLVGAATRGADRAHGARARARRSALRDEGAARRDGARIR